jgi:hypothetical protein
MNKLNTKHLTRSLLALFAGLWLSACDVVPTEQTDPTNSQAQGYTGSDCGAAFPDDPAKRADACKFRTEFWSKMSSSVCTNCHDGTYPADPDFLHQSDVDIAYSQALTVVDLTDPAQSVIVTNIVNNHQNACVDTASCAALATIVEGYLCNWIIGDCGAGGGSNEIALEAPAIKSAGTSKSLPDDSAAFAATVHPLLTEYCAGCHVESAPDAQSPFFAETDPAKAYDAIKSSQKINLDVPASSRLVVRLRDQFHNCWDNDCEASANLMQTKIEEFAAAVTASAVDPDWVVSKALNIATNGIVASGGARDDSSVIALYEFKDGSGTKIHDTSGEIPALDLDLYCTGGTCTEGIDYRWVGGWGMEFVGGKARFQGSTENSKKLYARIADPTTGTGEYSIEAWVVPANINQGAAGDPSRIISYSGSTDRRNFTLGQAEYRYEFMNRSANSDANGEPSLITDDDDEDLKATQHHVVVTYSPAGGRKVYVNGVDVSTVGNDAGSTDPVTPGSLTSWANNFALVFGAEAGGSDTWEGKLRFVAIHNRALTPTQVQQNFDAGVGEKFFLLFSVSPQMDDPNCFVPAAIPADEVHNCFVYFTVSQFDDYSYLFTEPTFISLNPAFEPKPGGTAIKGMRIGLNGKEPAVGQAYRNLDTTINATDYTTGTGQSLSDIGTIIALENGSDNDEFFLTFETLGAYSDVRVNEVCGVNKTCTVSSVDGDPASDVGLRTFEEIKASMATMTGVDPNLPQFAAVKNTYYDELNQTGIKQQMPTVESIDGFLSAHQMAIAQLAIQFCDALVEDGSLRSDFFGGFGFTSDVATAFGSGDSAAKNQIVDALYDKMAGYPDGGGVTLADMPTRAELKAELIGNPNPATPGHPGNLFDRLFATCSADPACIQDAARTRAIVKAMCTATLGSAAMLVQ